MCFSSRHFFLSNTRRESFKWLMTEMAPDFSFRKERFLCLKCNEKNIHQCWALECGCSQLINHKPLSICWSHRLTWESACSSHIYSVPTFPHRPRLHRQLPPWRPGPRIPPPYRGACCSIAKSWLTLCHLMDCSSPGSSVHGILFSFFHLALYFYFFNIHLFILIGG